MRELPRPYKLGCITPHPAGDSRETRGAQRRRLMHVGPLDGNAQNVRLELQQPVVGRRAAVDAQGFEFDMAPLGHHRQHLRRSVRHRLERRPGEMRASRPSGETHHRPACPWLPVRRAEADESGHEVDAIVGVERARESLALRRVVEDAESVTQPLDRGAGDED